MMKILIGTPIHICKDYCMEKWIHNIATLDYPVDLFLVDNSEGAEYIEKVKEYLKKYGVENCTIEHFEINNPTLNETQARSIKVEVAQEMIRRHALKENYDAWFSWECDQIIPTNGLNKLVELMKSEHCMMVVHNSWSRTNMTDFNANMGVTLISKEAMQKAWFMPEKNGEISMDISDSYNVDETMFKKRILRAGGNYIEAYGIVDPIYHLNN